MLVVLLSTALMDRLGRKPLLAASLGGMAAASLLLTAALLLGSAPLVVVAMVSLVLKSSPLAMTGRCRSSSSRWSSSCSLSALGSGPSSGCCTF